MLPDVVVCLLLVSHTSIYYRRRHDIWWHSYESGLDGMTSEEPTGDEIEERSDRYESIVETIPDGVFVLDQDGTITFLNEAIGAFVGIDRNTLVGETFETLVDSELFGPRAYDRFVESVTALSEEDAGVQHLTLETANEPARIVDLRLSEHTLDDGTKDIVGIVRDVTERERRLEAAERKRDVLEELYAIGSDASLTFERKAERILKIGCEYLELPYGFLTRIKEDVQQMVHTVGDHKLIQPDESVPLEKSYCRKTVKSDGLVGMEDAKTELGADDPAYRQFELKCYVGTKVVVGNDLYGTFCFAAPNARDRAFTSDEQEVIKLLGQWAGYELEQKRFEERLEGLHRISQRLLGAETTEEAAETAVRMGADLFELPVTAYWAYDPESELLRPLAETDECSEVIGETPTFERGHALVWESFDSGEIRSYEDVTERAEAYNPETEIRSEVHVPAGDHGVIISASTESRAFDDIDIESLRLLGALVEEAMTAVKREETLVERGEALQRQNEQLEEFAHVVAHDLRNPLAGAIGFLEIARETHDDSHFNRVETSLERMKDLIEQLLDIAEGSRQAVDPRSLPLAEIVEEAWSYVDAEGATLTVSDDLGEIYADETRLLQLFGNLFRNSVEHGSTRQDSRTHQDSVEHGGPDATVEVGRLESGSGFYVEDDGPGLSEEARENVLSLGKTTSESGTGIGLDSVTDIVEAHGWELTIPDTDGGARFEIRTGETGETEV